MPSERADSAELEAVTWNALSVCLSAVFVGNVLFSLTLFALTHGDRTTTATNTVTIQSDADKSALIEKLARENIDAKLHEPTSGL